MIKKIKNTTRSLRLKRQAYNEIRRTKKLGLPSTLGKNGEPTWEQVMIRFNYRCALTGTDQKLDFEHFIPCHIGHGGSIVGNVYPLTNILNESKGDTNPMLWAREQIQKGRISSLDWTKLVNYLAKQNGMTIEEYSRFVFWCFANPRTVEEAQKDTALGLTSVDLFRNANGRTVAK